MKTKIFSILLSLAAMAGFQACDSFEPENGGKGSGKLRTGSIGVEVDGAETSVKDQTGMRASARVEGRASVDISNFIVEVADGNGQTIKHWTYKNMEELPVFTPGTYDLFVKSHEVEPAAWNAPYFEGTQKFTIVADQVTEVETVVCKLSNIRVSVKFAAALVNAVDNASGISAKVTSEGNNSLTFTPSETRSGYFAALQNLETLRIDFSASINGENVSFTKTIDNVAKGQHRQITIGLTSNPNLPPEELGTVTNDGSGITVDTEVIEDEPIETDYPWYEDNIDDSGRPGEEDFDDPTKPDDPTPPTPSDYEITFTSEYLSLTGENDCDQFGEGKKPGVVTIYSSKGFSHLNVKIVSDMLTDDFLKPVGLVSEFDLANPPKFEYDGETKDTTDGLRGLGFPVKDEVTGIDPATGEMYRTIDFEITQFIPLIFQPGLHQFHITVVDKENNSKSITLLLRKN